MSGNERTGSANQRIAVMTIIVTLACITTLYQQVHSFQSAGGEPVSSSEDLSGDEQTDTVTSDSWNEDEPAPGEVTIQSSDDSNITLTGTEDDDRFGEAVNPTTDLNGDGFKDLIIGAPGKGTGEAYVFYGPFDDDYPTTRDAGDADLTFFGPHPEEYDFGERAAPVVDLNGDGIHDIRIRSWQNNPDGEADARTYLFSGVDGAPIYFIKNIEPFDPWPFIAADANDDGEVNQTDRDIALLNQGRSGDVTYMDGDVNEDGTVNQTDLDLIDTAFGYNAIYDDPVGGVIGIPEPPDDCDPQVFADPDFQCIEDCEGDPIIMPGNVYPMCDGPYICHAWCGFELYGPSPGTQPVADATVIQKIEITGLEPQSSEWIIEVGENNIEILAYPTIASPYFEFLPVSPGIVKILVRHEVCTYVCEKEIEFAISFDPDDSDGDGYPDWIEECLGSDPMYWLSIPSIGLEDDSDNDGVEDYIEICVNGTDPNYYDTDGDGLPDSWELENGFDPLNPDSNGNGIPDNEEDADGDGVSNHDEYIYGTDPNNADSDGDGVSDADEIDQCGNPNDASDGGMPPPEENQVQVKLTIGDPSGSHSEHWEIRVGDINFKAPGYGEVDDRTFCFQRGKSYNIEVVHLGTNCDEPDYDYTAAVEIIDGCGLVDDPQDLLGDIGVFGGCGSGTSPNHAEGKEATLIFPKVDLDIDSNNDGSIDGTDDEIEEESPGRFIVFNDDDDNQNGTSDFGEPGPTVAEVDLVQVSLSVDIPAPEFQWKLIYSESLIQLWRNADRTNPLDSDVFYSDPVLNRFALFCARW